MLVLKLNHVSQRDHWRFPKQFICQIIWIILMLGRYRPQDNQKSDVCLYICPCLLLLFIWCTGLQIKFIQICLILSYSSPSEVMSTPVVVFRTVEKIGRIVKIIEDENAHNGFPVVEDYDPDRDEFVSRGHGWGGESAGRICRQVCIYGVRFGASLYPRGSARGEFRQDYGDGLLFLLGSSGHTKGRLFSIGSGDYA